MTDDRFPELTPEQLAKYWREVDKQVNWLGTGLEGLQDLLKLRDAFNEARTRYAEFPFAQKLLDGIEALP